MKFSHSRGGVLKIGPDALAAMRRYEQHAPDATEAGGLLLGRYLLDGRHLVRPSPQPLGRVARIFQRRGLWSLSAEMLAPSDDSAQAKASDDSAPPRP